MFRRSGKTSPRRLSAMSMVVSVCALLGVMGTIIGTGCGTGINPFLAAQFAQNTIGTNLPGRVTPPTTAPTGGGTGGTDGILDTICEVQEDQRTIQVVLQNEAQQPVQFAMSFLVTAGTGGFVCAEELSRYLNAGYTDAIAPGQTSEVIGCYEITVPAGTRLLRLDFGVNNNQRLDANTGGAGSNTMLPLTTRNNSLDIPTPEIIVFGDSDPNFRCTGSTAASLCTQRGFVYVNPSNIPLGKAAEALRIQGSTCNEGFGTAPDWRLDKTSTDNVSLANQYVSGGTIVATVLDRSGDSPAVTRNQVVWLVTDANTQRVIHNEDRGG